MADNGEVDTRKIENAAMLAYLLLLVVPLLLFTPVIGVIVAYVYRDDAPEWLQSHFQLQIRTFWIGLLFLLIGSITLVIIIGKLLLLIALIWYLVRVIKGIKTLNEKKPYPNPTSWGL